AATPRRGSLLYKRQVITVAALVASVVAFAGGPKKPKALMVMMDGLRGDAVENAPMPNLLALREGRWRPGYKGFSTLTAHTLYDARPSSAANHCAIATGVTAEKSRIFKNGDTPNGNFAEWPSWLVRLVNARPGTKALYTYSWKGDIELSPHPNVQNLRLTTVCDVNWPTIPGSYAKYASTVPKIMASCDAPDAVIYFIDIADLGGHRTGFYPYGKEYLHDARLVDRIIGDTLAAIASRPQFDDEDWLIMITSDHGGYGKSHGIWGGHATTIPLIVAGRNVPQGEISGMPRNFDLAPMALAHFGLDVKKMNLDGKSLGAPLAVKTRGLADGLAAYLPFTDAEPVNAVTGAIAAKAYGKTASGIDGGMFGRCLRVAADEKGACGVSLNGSEKLEFENGSDFTVALWLRLDEQQEPQAPIFANKDWESGKNPGVVLIGARKTDAVKIFGVCFNGGLSGDAQRIDMGTFDINYGEWCFYAVTRRADGVLTIYQGGQDGHLYWIAEDASALVLKTGLPFWIGQDGTGKCKVSLKGDVDDFALWTRSLSRDEIRRIHDEGRRGNALGSLLGSK
ncbi:MAG: alkaline phosphatase family protein, partial [Kiritimatiellae bacterium]|nr:alkaline phosphatase family protein [Kiritimatiellia bacterium]